MCRSIFKWPMMIIHIHNLLISLSAFVGIKIRFLGEAQTKWVETETRKKEDGTAEEHRTDVTGSEEYFQINYYLLGGANASETELPAGVHTYPFTCTLPPAVPSSFEGELGFVRYTVKVTLDRPWKFDQDTKMAFTVISPLDMNLMEKVGEPEKLVMEKTFCCWCCKSAPLSVVVSLPVKGYVSGQIIPLLFEIDNRSNVEVEKIKFAFTKHVAYHSMAPRTTRRDDKVLAELTLGPYMPGDQKTVKQMIEIPSVPPTSEMFNAVNYSVLISCIFQISVARHVHSSTCSTICRSSVK